MNALIVGLLGQVRAKVSTENGNIAAGDYLTASSFPGVAARATGAGNVIGIAQESYSGAAVARISVLVRPQFWVPSVLTVLATGQVGVAGNLAVTGNATVGGNLAVTGDVNVTGTGAFKNLIATDGLKIGSAGDNIAQLNHGVAVGACPRTQ